MTRLLIALALASFALIGSYPALAQNKAQVTVVNPTTSPVNIQGPVTVTNSVLPVEVSNADPIPVLMSTQPAAIVQKGVAVPLDFGAIPGRCDIYTVPPGKRLVVEYVNFEVGASSFDTGKIVHVTIRKENTAVPGSFYFLHLPGQMAPAGFYVISQSIKMYADAGETVYGIVAHQGITSEAAFFGCRIAGRLEDLT